MVINSQDMVESKVANQLRAMTPFINCCDRPYLRQIEPQSAHSTTEANILRLDQPPLAVCRNCHQIVAACPRCDQGFSAASSLAEWQNHYSQFAYYDSSATLQRAQQLLGDGFPSQTFETGHRFYTLWHGTCQRHPQSYIWLQERPVKCA